MTRKRDSKMSVSCTRRVRTSAVGRLWFHALLLALVVHFSALTHATYGQEQPSERLPAVPPETSEGVENGGDSEEALEAEELDAIDLFDMEVPVVITASRRAQRISDVPYAISVISAEDIRRSGVRSVPDALRLVPGMDVAELAYGQYAVSARGFHSFSSTKLLVLVDGRQIYDTLMAGTIWNFWPFQLEDIQRIEVIRGPGGVTWGANAVNGVVNIITKDPGDQQGLTLRLGGGSRGTHREYLGYAFKEDGLRLRISGEFEGSEGYVGAGSGLTGFQDRMRAVRTGVYGVYETAPDQRLTFSAGSAVVRDGFPLPLMQRITAHRAEGETNFLLTKWTHDIAEDNTLELTAFVNDFHISSGPRWLEYRYQQVAFQIGHSFKLSDKHTLTWGLDTRWDLTSAANADPFMLTRDIVRTGAVGLYLQDEWSLAPRWNLGLGGRLDYDFYGGFESAARASLSYDLAEGAVLYGAVSRAVHMPPAARRFLDFPIADPILHIVGARDLDAEQLLAFELGYRGRFFDRLAVNVNMFWHDYRDLIANKTGFGPPGLLSFTSANTHQLGLYGIELETRYTASDQLTLLGHYTFQLLDSSVSLNGMDSITPPQHKFMLGARWSPAEDLHVSSHLYYVSDVTADSAESPGSTNDIDDYFRLDLQAEYEFWNDRAALALGVRNLLDRQHPEGGSTAVDSGEIPRMIYAELRISFD